MTGILIEMSKHAGCPASLGETLGEFILGDWLAWTVQLAV